jgi:hypothetical protein
MILVTLSLESFVNECHGGQSEAANRIGCNQANVSKHLREIKKGKKQVLITLQDNSVIDAVIIKPFCKQRSSMTYRPVVCNPS